MTFYPVLKFIMNIKSNIGTATGPKAGSVFTINNLLSRKQMDCLKIVILIRIFLFTTLLIEQFS